MLFRSGDGQINRNELKNAMKLNDADLDIVFALGDLDGDGEISMGEFILIMSPAANNAVKRFRNCFKDIHDVVSGFCQFDSDGDGSITQQELAAGMRNMRMSFSNEETNAIFAAADTDTNGEINYSEFVSLMIPTCGDALIKFRKCFNGAQSAKNSFNKFDTDGDAEISFDEMKKGMGGKFSDQEVRAVFALGDTDQDGSITFLEFAKLVVPAANEVLAKFWKCFRDLKSVRAAFKQFDTDNDGSISKQEVVQGMKTTGKNFNQEEVETLFVLADKDGDGAIDFPEFALIMIPTAPERLAKLKHFLDTNKDGKLSKSEVEAAFKRFDSNNDGAIDANEMKNGLKSSGISMTDQEVETIFAVADLDGDGEVTMAEFSCLLIGGTAPPTAKAPQAGGGAAAPVVAKFRSMNRTIDQVRAAFNKYDTDRDGNISRAELQDRKSVV